MSDTPWPPIYELGNDFFDEVEPARFSHPQLRYRNQAAAESIGLGHLSTEAWQEHFSAFEPLPGNIKKPLALRYHGHQFQVYNPDLGDGRGFLFAQIKTPHRLFDLGTKGSGQTPYSRRGDGRLTLKGAFREILATEILESYGVNTSRTFSVFETGESLERHDEPSPTRAGVLVRLNHSHIRYGTFQRLAFLQQKENIEKLLDYVVRHYYPELKPFTGTELAEKFLKAVCLCATETLAQWMMAGFVHGVLNTDNMNITGESFDYGPYRFLPHYDPNFTAAYFDHSGLYAFGRQPTTVYWNLHQLAGALKFAFPELSIEAGLEEFPDNFNFQIQQGLLRRLNLKNPLSEPQEASDLNSQLLTALFSFMDKEKTHFEQTFFDLHSGITPARLEKSPQKEVYKKESFKELQEVLSKFSVDSKEKQEHPYFKNTHACSLLIDEIEAIWKDIAERDDWAWFERKLQEIRSFRGVY
ncbi:selenoprotein O [Bdellovibrio bacteriovorus]|uniref:Protein nucleotidyltransferase YdiU n=1 Tax=Bdellovibrio bacteriovorus TaxID=959 RepID=A0A150WKI5_BDEBC|nr:YdiU family protein [Bdellovibrio bacteriovorus]KYG64095.1 selenoprotein O [Bdellovibrio bacteriovorus]